MALLHDAHPPRPGLRAMLDRLVARARRGPVPPDAPRAVPPLRRPPGPRGDSPGTDAAVRLLLRDLGHR